MNVPFVPGGRNSFPSGFSQLFSRMGLNSIELAQCQEAEGTESLSQPPSPEMATASLRPVSCPYWSVLHCPSFLSEESFPLLLCLSPSCSLRHLEPPPPTSISGFPGGSVVKNPPANAGDVGDVCSIPGSGRSPGGGNGNPLQYSCLENSMDRGA